MTKYWRQDPKIKECEDHPGFNYGLENWGYCEGCAERSMGRQADMHPFRLGVPIVKLKENKDASL